MIGGVKDDKALKGYQVVHFQPFDPVHKRTEATVKGADGKQFYVAKGAPQVILEMSTNAGEVKPAVEKAVNEFAGRGFRSLGVARADQEGKWQFVGVLPLFDPPREQAKATIASARQMGVSVKMVTGDQMAIAKETAKQLGMGTNILDASGLGDTKHHETAQSAEAIEKADGFAQVFPEHKFHIVDVLQQRGHIVGMTGDGVNDAPALKKADCGIAVSGATDAARAAASIVLLASGLSVIIDAIKESRRIFQRMNSYAIYRIAETLRVLFFMTLAILVFNFYPVTAVMIVMLALLNDGAILSIAYDNVHYKDKPEAWNMRLVLGISTVLGVIGVVAAFGLFYLGERVFHLDRAHIQTLMYLKLSVAGHLTIFLTRTRGPFWSIRPARILWMAVLGTQTVATLIAVYGLFMTPLGWGWAAFVWGYALAWALVNDRVKLLAYRIFDPTKAPLLAKKSSGRSDNRRSPHGPMKSTRSEATTMARQIKTGLRRRSRPRRMRSRPSRFSGHRRWLKMKINSKDFRVRPGKKVKLSEWPTIVKPFCKSKEEYQELLEEHVEKLSSLQQLHYASNRYALLLIFQGMDAAGKDGAIRHVMSGVNPQGCEVFSFKQPSADELEHDFLWRTTRCLPERGRIGIFNRSYYEEVLVVRVHPEILRSQGLPEELRDEKTIWEERYRSIVDLESHLHRNGTRTVKIFLHLSKEEQRKRFLERIDEPDKNWKFSLADIHERKYWKHYMKAYEECLSATSTHHAPWYVVPADDKENARLIVSQIVLDALNDLKMAYPKTTPKRRRGIEIHPQAAGEVELACSSRVLGANFG